jgi:hypothetical protein
MHPAPPPQSARPISRHHRNILAILLLLPLTLPAQQASLNQPALPPIQPVVAAVALPPSQLIVIGFAGGFIKRTSSIHGEIGLALHLREKYGTALHSEVFENHHGDAAHREILRLLALNPPTRKQPARIILYGHSWGASEAVSVARQLQRDEIPVLLLVQVDGVPKREQDDSIIPANVAQAINFYQTEGLLHGRATISAADPTATKILDNVQLTYKHNDVPTPGYPWIARTFTHRHIEIENDPRVWDRVESMILANLH